MEVDDDELYIRRVFSFDEWEYNHPQHNVKSPLHREPLASNHDMNRYNDSLKTLLQLPARTSSSNPSLFQELWDKKMKDEERELGYQSASFATATATTTTTTLSTIPSPESAFRQFQQHKRNEEYVVSPIDTSLPFLSGEAPWCPNIPREEESSFVHIEYNHYEYSTTNNSSSQECGSTSRQQQQPPPPQACWSIPEYVLVPQQQQDCSSNSMEEIQL
ncbi:MAG: hypothetical protein SGBAC_007735 [Bacillariaceae sp.]